MADLIEIDHIQQAGERLVKLRAMLRAREGRIGFEKNVTEIKAEIARLETITKNPA